MKDIIFIIAISVFLVAYANYIVVLTNKTEGWEKFLYICLSGGSIVTVFALAPHYISGK